MELKLKPCPECGSTFILVWERWGIKEGKICYSYTAGCDNCGYDDENESPTAEAAAELWNRREDDS